MDSIFNFTHKINYKYFYKTHYLLKIKYLNYCEKKQLAPLIHF